MTMTMKQAIAAYHERPSECAEFLAGLPPHNVVQFMAELVSSGHNPTEGELMHLTMEVLRYKK